MREEYLVREGKAWNFYNKMFWEREYSHNFYNYYYLSLHYYTYPTLLLVINHSMHLSFNAYIGVCLLYNAVSFRGTEKWVSHPYTRAPPLDFLILQVSTALYLGLPGPHPAFSVVTSFTHSISLFHQHESILISQFIPCPSPSASIQMFSMCVSISTL